MEKKVVTLDEHDLQLLKSSCVIAADYNKWWSSYLQETVTATKQLMYPNGTWSNHFEVEYSPIYF